MSAASLMQPLARVTAVEEIVSEQGERWNLLRISITARGVPWASRKSPNGTRNRCEFWERKFTSW